MIKVCRLISGEVLVADWTEEPVMNDDQHIAKGKAMCTLQGDPAGKMALVPWIPGGDIRGETEIPSKMVMAVTTPDEQMNNVYNQQFGSGIQLARTMPADLKNVGDGSQIIK